MDCTASVDCQKHFTQLFLTFILNSVTTGTGLRLNIFCGSYTINYIIKMKTMPIFLAKGILYNFMSLEKMILIYSNIVSNIQTKKFGFFICMFALII